MPAPAITALEIIVYSIALIWRSALLCLLLTGLLSPSLAAQPPARWVEVILDASGSMKAKLPSGQTRLEAAKEAVAKLAPSLPPETMLALRAYGHQSPTAKHDCEDTQLLVPFGPAGELAAKVAEKAKELPAQGYTPITYALTLAAADFPAQAQGQRVMVLVSDGKETCAGDPCAMAKALADKFQVVIHTVGLGVDQATQAQLTCLASQTGGRYFAAGSAPELAAALGQAAQAKVEKRVIKKSGPGRLTISKPDLRGHQVMRAEDGQKVADLSHVKGSTELPAGIYNISVGKAWWKSVEVRPGETTTLDPARLTVKHASLSGHAILDPETGEEMGSVSATLNNISLMPGEYEVAFGPLRWPVRLEPGQSLTLEPGVITLKGAKITGHAVLDAQGRQVGSVSATGSSIALPPGDYELDLQGIREKVSLGAGQRVELEWR